MLFSGQAPNPLVQTLWLSALLKQPLPVLIWHSKFLQSFPFTVLDIGRTNSSGSSTSLISPARKNFTPSPVNAHTSSFYFGSNPPSVILNPDIHPYANPDFALPTEKSVPFPVSRSDSTSTLTHPPFSAPVSQPEQYSPRHALQRGEISSPMAINSAKTDPKLIPPTARELVSWVDKGSAPPFTLISLEEARSQRSRSATVQTSTAEDYEMSSNHSPTSSVSSRARIRSSSAAGYVHPKNTVATI